MSYVSDDQVFVRGKVFQILQIGSTVKAVSLEEISKVIVVQRSLNFWVETSQGEVIWSLQFIENLVFEGEGLDYHKTNIQTLWTN